jgi:hypothetical protein
MIVDDLRQYLEARNRQVSAKAKLGEVIRYALTRWNGLSRHSHPEFASHTNNHGLSHRQV